MTKYLPLIVILCLGNLIACPGAGAAALDYKVSITAPAAHLAHVTITLNNISDLKSFTLASHTWETNHLYFQNISLTDGSGNPIHYEHRQTSDSFVEQLLEVENANGLNTLILDYDVHYLVTDNNDLETINSGILSDRAIFDMSHFLFNFHGATVPFDTRYVPTSITFEIPDSWRMVTSWEGDGGTYAESNEKIILPTPTCGDYLVEEINIKGLKVRAAIPNRGRDQMPVPVEKVMALIRDGVAEMQAVYGNPSQSKLGLNDTVALVGSCKPMATQESGYGTAYFAVDSSLENFPHSLAHALTRILRFWMGDEPDTYWVPNTMALYESALNIRRLGYESTEWLNGRVREWADIYTDEVWGGKYDLPIPDLMNRLYYNNRNDLTEEDRLGYQRAMDSKGSLFWVCLNGLIREKTNGVKDLYDFSAAMNKMFADHYTVQDIIGVLNSLTGWDFSGFFQSHFYGNERLPLESYLTH